MAERELFVNCIDVVEIDGDRNIPTVVCYRPSGPLVIGNEALMDEVKGLIVNEDFKIDLGRYATTVQSKRRYVTARGEEKSAAQIADDFLFEVLKHTHSWLTARGIGECRNVVIAEPLSMHTEQVSPEWLSNYRDTLRRIISGKRVLSEHGIDLRFLPEPFAVFQYYRYGLRHPLVSDKSQMNLLVIDFGGGTFDICVIETTKEGDISKGGKNSRPLAGKSLPVGGFTINRELAKRLLRKANPKHFESEYKKGLRLYDDWLKGEVDLQVLQETYRFFITSFHRLVHRIEQPKKALSRNITDWRLDAQNSFSVPVPVPSDPFQRRPDEREVQLTYEDFKDVFINHIYKPHLRNFIRERLDAARQALDHNALSAVLLSGGSANIGWLKVLMEQDFGELLQGAPFLQIEDYQEVVAKGLAVDCARQFATGVSEFQATTYNPLFLLLDPDHTGCEPRPFIVRTKELPEVKGTPGLLLPTASIMTALVDKPLQWKVRLSRAPKHTLNYYFLESSMDYTNIKFLQNVEETTLTTPAKTEFDSHLVVELMINRERGTAEPRFIYKSSDKGEISKRGRPFFVDMTDAAGIAGKAYVGIDFGTSNTAVSYIDEKAVQLVERKRNDRGWRALHELVDVLPYPLADPLARYIGVYPSKSLVSPGNSFLECSLCLLAYCAYMDYCSADRRNTSRMFKNFSHRAATPNFLLLRSAISHAGSSSEFCMLLREGLDERSLALLERACRIWADTKHEMRRDDSADIDEAIRLLANVCGQVFNRYLFGYFEHVRKLGLRSTYSGLFRVAHGRPPFTRYLKYTGPEVFSDVQAILVNADSGRGVPLTPLILWYPCEKHPDADCHCFFFDKLSDGERLVRFKAASFPCVKDVREQDENLGEVYGDVASLRTEDPVIDVYTGLNLASC